MTCRLASWNGSAVVSRATHTNASCVRTSEHDWQAICLSFSSGKMLREVL
jgi:hypothetical protein